MKIKIPKMSIFSSYKIENSWKGKYWLAINFSQSEIVLHSNSRKYDYYSKWLVNMGPVCYWVPAASLP